METLCNCELKLLVFFFLPCMYSDNMMTPLLWKSYNNLQLSVNLLKNIFSDHDCYFKIRLYRYQLKIMNFLKLFLKNDL